ncbi:Serine/threonine-protein phosphatase [Durusdinium trenchii]|uniref:Serine/threonine-protein phosphatase n=1 Tax=Durusdinium trenchii TaxID=1381693 RepID=A0ABP0JW83_9DINO
MCPRSWPWLMCTVAPPFAHLLCGSDLIHRGVAPGCVSIRRGYAELAPLMGLKTVTLRDFWQKVKEDAGNPMAPLEPLLQQGLPFASDWDDQNVRQVLPEYEPPEITKELLQVYLSRLEIA